MQAKLEKLYRVELPALDPLEGTESEIMQEIPNLRMRLEELINSLFSIESKLRDEHRLAVSIDPMTHKRVREIHESDEVRHSSNPFIQTIKQARTEFNLGLKDAKDLVESVIGRPPTRW